MKKEYLPDDFEVGKTGYGGEPRYGNIIFQSRSGKYRHDVIKKWKQAFLEAEDATEYKFGLEVAGDWEVYQKIKSSSRILRNELLPKWHAELEVKLRSKALETLIQDATSKKSKSAPSSAKWLENKLSNLDKDRCKTDYDEVKKRNEATLSNVTKLYDRIKKA